MELTDYIGQLTKERESVELEFKSGKGGFPRSFWETYSSFANTDGGVIVLGVTEKDGHFVADGLSEEQIENYKTHFWNNVNNRNTVSVNLMTNKDVEDGEHEGNRLLLFRVPRADREQRPVYLTPQPYGNTYRRYNEGDFVCDDGVVRRMFAEDDSKIRWIDRVYPDGTWEANLFQFYRRVLPKLQNAIPRPFRMEGNTRMDNSPTHDALREALVNFSVHAYYSTEAALVITRTPDKIVFSNPGTLLVSRDQFYSGGESECRNPSLQKMFMMLGDAEKAGSGTAKIIKGWKSIGLEAPYIREKHKPDKVELVMAVGKVDDSEQKVDTSEQKVDTSESKYIRRNTLLEIILAGCEDWRTVEEIAAIVNRKTQYIKNKILPLIIRDKRFEMRYPEQKNHPNQMYRAKAVETI